MKNPDALRGLALKLVALPPEIVRALSVEDQETIGRAKEFLAAQPEKTGGENHEN